MALLSASLIMRAFVPAPTRTGAFSPISVLFLVFIILLGLVMLVALIVLAMGGRFGAAGPQDDSFETQLSATPGAGSPPPTETAAAQGEEAGNGAPSGTAIKRLAALASRFWHSGLAQALMSVLLPIPAMAVFYGLENIYGRPSAFTLGAALLLLLLAAQVFFVCRLVSFLRRSK